ncbi:MAG: hypothetical protein OQK96_05355, partial [Gammaproteobacteria bacterium]|nr:hypothetical protein [Gammaproteobacteria bacterium]
DPLVVDADTTIEAVQVVSDTITAYGDYLVGDVLYNDTNGNATADDAPIMDGRLYTDTAMTELRVADGYGGLAVAGIPYYGDGAEMSAVKLSDNDDTAADTAYTGLSVAEGATLTIDNVNSYSSIYFANDVINAGTITWGDHESMGVIASDNAITNGGVIDNSGAAAGDDSGYVWLYGNAIANGGTINAAGADGGEFGGDGGDVMLYGIAGVVNDGDINVVGGHGDAETFTIAYGGDGGEIVLYGGHAENVSNLDVSGGDGDSPGWGGSLFLAAMGVEELVEVNNSGNIKANPGIGESAANGGVVALYGLYADITNSGDIDVSGGYGGYGMTGSMMMSWYGSVVSNANIDASGGIFAEGEYGGNGGMIGFQSYSYYDPASITVSGNLNVSGGDGDSFAGRGGQIQVINYAAGEGSGVAMLGYKKIDGHGGDGMFPGSGGGAMMASIGFDAYVGGPLENHANIDVRGGSAHGDIASSETSGSGGYGGVVMMASYHDTAGTPDTAMTLPNSGSIDASGGTVVNAGSFSAAEGGWIEMEGTAGISNSGKLMANGGDDIGDSESASYGGLGGEVGVYTGEGDFNAKNSATIQVNGGDGTFAGGHGGFAGVGGWGSVSNSGNIYADGGNASTNIVASFGGDGGEVEVVHIMAGEENFSNSGTLSANGGAGVTEGADGVITQGVTIP